MKTILLPLDGSRFAEQALPHALALCSAGDRLILLRIVPPDDTHSYVESHLAEQALLEARHYLEALAADLRRPETTLVPRALVGSARDLILEAARDEHADLLVMSSHGRTGWKRWVLGSVAESVAREAPCTMWLIRCEEPAADTRLKAPDLRRVLVPLDLSPRGDRALQFVEEWLGGPEVHLLLLTASASREQAQGELATRVNSLRERGFQVEGRVHSGPPAVTILDEARTEDVGLIVLTSHGRTGLARLLIGSVAEQVVRHAPCPVALIPART